ncbi:DUF4348 domain-containing protein [Flavobacterium sp. J49]|uniref:DUF4348 domain-containing protein n=1 Tax=Flavobacterium sp. J49 TaxID=2718534 RepID=UPI001593B8A1|nr:DUF4348 domain-containing protein [Flavobacterium sp. J49]MBF6640277.1 DUF4348 domain-containing protein [Flavobacterium sp. J49]NIC01522.1 DUF4348 domain-containing protein [Flavobacterium sp. J49]
MKVIKTYLYLILVLILSGCKTETGKVEIEKELIENHIPENVDEDFKTFLGFFSKDSIFQVSRVKFPLKVMEVDENNMLESKENVIQKNEYSTLDFEYPKDALTRELDRYTQNIKTKGNETVIEIRGVDNGIYSDFFFEKVGGKWFLKSWDDKSN